MPKQRQILAPQRILYKPNKLQKSIFIQPLCYILAIFTYLCIIKNAHIVCIQTKESVMKNNGIICILSLFTMALFLPSCNNKPKETGGTAAIDTIPQLVMQIKKCSHLYTAELKVHKIITHSDNVRVKGKIFNQDYDVALPIGARHVAIPMDATMKAYVDFGDFSAQNVKRNGEKLEIILPDPHVELSSTKISHNEIKSYVALLRQNFSDKELSDYEHQGREAIIKGIADTDIIEMARESAAKTLVPLFVALGYEEKNVTVSFSKDFQSSGIKRIIEEAER